MVLERGGRECECREGRGGVCMLGKVADEGGDKGEEWGNGRALRFNYVY